MLYVENKGSSNSTGNGALSKKKFPVNIEYVFTCRQIADTAQQKPEPGLQNCGLRLSGTLE